ncbi:MAG: ChaN family lipoprotein [Aquabacterium sp.]|nr:ChaN family lipoprotein [Aquabacterium sp.]
MHPTCRPIAAAALALLVTACSALPGRPAPPATPGTPAWRAGPGQVLLLGEVHDNAAQHALRLQALAALLARGDRPALLLEPFDRERQPAIDLALQATAAGPPDAPLAARIDAVIAASGQVAGWDWPLYRPYLGLALQHGLPIVAANVSRAETRRIIQLGLGPTGWLAEVPEDIARAQADAIERSHCGQVDAGMAARLSQAQVARDQFMARLIGTHAARGVVLLAGNGHVRRDIGVPRWLSPALRERSHVVGYLEPDDDSASAYDEVVRTVAQPRQDPCAQMRRAPPLRPSASAAPAAPASR